MKNVKRVVAVILSCIMTLGFAGCKKNEEVNSGKTVVTMWSRITSDSSQVDKDAEQFMIEKLAEKFPDIEVKLIHKPMSTDYRQEYDKALMAKQAPDLFVEFSYTDIPTRIKNGTIADITDFVKNWKYKAEDKVITTFDQAISSDGKWYAIPRSSYVQASVVNLKSIKDAGGDVNNLPKTWKEFADFGQKLTDISIPRICYQITGSVWQFTPWMWSAGGEMVKPNGDGTYKITFNSEEGVDTAEFMNQMVWKYKMTQKNIMGDSSEISNNIKSGAALYAWAQLANVINKDTVERNGFTYNDFTQELIPAKDSNHEGAALAGGEVITFSPHADKKTLEAAFRVAEYLYYDEEYLEELWKNQDAAGLVDTMVPARKDLYEKKLATYSQLNNENREALLKIQSYAKPEPFCGNWSELKGKLKEYLEKIYLKENISRKEIKSLLDQCAEELYSTYPNSFQKK